MIEKGIFDNLPNKKLAFHSAILICYSINLDYFENQVLPLLKKKWISSINILADTNALTEAINTAAFNTSSVSQTYAVNGISSKGVFHPKINFFIGDQALFATVGSGNISNGGHGKNHEVFCEFYADSDNQVQLSILLEIWNYVSTFTKSIGRYSTQRTLYTIPRNCTLLSNIPKNKHQFTRISEQFSLALLYNEQTSILQQLLQLLPISSITKITVVCPFFDKDGSALLELSSLFKKAIIDVYLQKENCLPPVNITVNKALNFYDFEHTERGKITTGKAPYSRRLHSKIIIFESPASVFCMLGSANITTAGLGGTKKLPSNDELSTLYKSKNFDFVKELGITGKKQKLDISKLIRSDLHDLELKRQNSKRKFQISCAEISNLNLCIYFRKLEKAAGFTVAICSNSAEAIFEADITELSSTETNFTLPSDGLKAVPLYCVILDSEKRVVSNKVTIANLTKLEYTNPSTAMRNIQQLIGRIEDRSFNEFEIAEFLNNLLYEPQPIEKSEAPKNAVKKANLNPEEVSNLTYEDAITYLQNAKGIESNLLSSPGSRIWQGLENYFTHKKNSLDETQFDEEEEGAATSSHKRIANWDKDSSEAIPISKSILSNYRKHLTDLSSNYIFALETLKYNSSYALGETDFHNFNLTSFLLSKVCFYTSYEIITLDSSKSKLVSVNDVILKENWLIDLNNRYYDSMIKILHQLAFVYSKNQNLKEHEHSRDCPIIADSANSVFQSVLLINVHLLLKFNYESIFEQRLVLFLLNIIRKIPKIELLNNRFITSYLYSLSINTLTTEHIARTINELTKITQTTEYVQSKKHGICKVIERTSNSIKVDSIYGVYLLSEKEITPLRHKS